ncbi:MAG TPA: GYD domain-containing protein [Stellaceae bacterium]|nr:GYD domain-containing protein [Stellaceae bacterium]
MKFVSPDRLATTEAKMALFMYQLAYTPQSWAAQLKNPKSRVETVGHSLCEAAGGKFVAGWYCFGEYDAILIADMPDAESMSALALSVAAGGAVKASKTTALMTGAQAVASMTKAATLAKTYQPAR